MEGKPYRVVLIGDAGVGKTTFISRLKDNSEMSDKNKLRCSCTKLYTIDGQKVKFQVFDTAGEEAHRSVSPSYYRRADVAVCMYCEDKPHSQLNLADWINQVNAVAKNPIIVVIANSRSQNEYENMKIPEDLNAFCTNYGVKLHFRISAVSQQQVEETVEQIARAVHTRNFETKKAFITDSHEKEPLEEETIESSIMLSKCPQPRKKSCCVAGGWATVTGE